MATPCDSPGQQTRVLLSPPQVPDFPNLPTYVPMPHLQDSSPRPLRAAACQTRVLMLTAGQPPPSLSSSSCDFLLALPEGLSSLDPPRGSGPHARLVGAEGFLGAPLLPHPMALARSHAIPAS